MKELLSHYRTMLVIRLFEQKVGRFGRVGGGITSRLPYHYFRIQVLRQGRVSQSTGTISSDIAKEQLWSSLIDKPTSKWQHIFQKRLVIASTVSNGAPKEEQQCKS